MAHHHLRTEKVCLNCDAQVPGRYCTDCGQENVDPKETVGHLFRHFIEDITHFDGKFFQSMKYLIARPGFLTQEYLAGKRARYLHPVRMYMFISAVFFFLLVTFFLPRNDSIFTTPEKTNTSAQVTAANASVRARDSIKKHTPLHLTTSIDYDNVHEYDSAQKALPREKRDNFFAHFMRRRAIAGYELGHKNPDEFYHRFSEKFFHSFPQMFFLALPLFALLLQLLYMRRRKNYNYVSHTIFTIHFYCFTFIAWTAIMAIGDLGDIGNYASLAIFLLLFVYLYIAMLRFYKQGWFKTFSKFLLLNISMSVVLVVIMLIYIVNSFLSVANT